MMDSFQTDNYEEKRRKMVEAQLIDRGIRNKEVLSAILKVKRHLFVPKELADQAYGDHPLPIGHDQTISQPYIVAFMTEAICQEKPKKVLEIGTGSGYQTAVLAEICDAVYSIEIIQGLGKKAKRVIDSLGYNNVFIKLGNGYEGWKEFAPFDAITVTCAPIHVPEPLKEQLAEDGRMIIPVGEFHSQKLFLIRKQNGGLKQEAILPVMFVPMVNNSE